MCEIPLSVIALLSTTESNIANLTLYVIYILSTTEINIAILTFSLHLTTREYV